MSFELVSSSSLPLLVVATGRLVADRRIFGVAVTWLMVLTLPYLCAAYATNKIWQSRGVDGFKNPGGWKFPAGEVAAFAGAFVGVVLMLMVAAVVG